MRFILALLMLLAASQLGKKTPPDRRVDQEDLNDLVAHLRPHMAKAEVDRLADASDGRLSSETLANRGAWRSYGKQPCLLTIDYRTGTISDVWFPPLMAERLGVMPYGDPQTALDNIKGAAVYRGRRTWSEAGETIVEVATQSPDIMLHFHYFHRGLGWIAYVFSDAYAETLEAQQRAEYLAERRARPKKKPDEAARKRSAEAMVRRSQTERVLEPDIPFKFAEFVEMVRHLRPGMPVSALEAVEKQSYGLLTQPLLSNMKAWRKAYDMRQPCVVTVKQGVISCVKFGHGRPVLDVVVGTKTAQDLINKVPDARRASDREVRRDAWVELPSDGPGYRTFVGYKPGHLSEIVFETAEAVNAATAASQDRKAALDAIDAEQKTRHETPEQRLARLGADGVLRAVMHERSLQTDDDTYSDIAEWVITSATLDDRHSLLDFNWDLGFDLPNWIIRQPDTDPATALKAFYYADAPTYLRKAADGDTTSESVAFSLELKARLEQGFYTPSAEHAPIAFEVPKYALNMPEEVRALLPAEALRSLPGRATRELRNTFPTEWGDYLN